MIITPVSGGDGRSSHPSHFINWMMKKSVNSTIRYSLRALPILGVLLALCISEGVGLQLLPLRNFAPTTTDLLKVSGARGSSPLPSPVSPALRKVDISSPTLNRIAVEQQINHFVSLPLSLVCDVADVVPLPKTVYYSQADYSVDFFSRPSDRAPPAVA
ncbi:MAG: hypothetical protein AB1757_02100 [Acidobacteriota bacterium]